MWMSVTGADNCTSCVQGRMAARAGEVAKGLLQYTQNV